MSSNNKTLERFSIALMNCKVIQLLNVKKILAVINATYAVAKRKFENIRLAGIRTLTSAIPVAFFSQLHKLR